MRTQVHTTQRKNQKQTINKNQVKDPMQRGLVATKWQSTLGRVSMGVWTPDRIHHLQARAFALEIGNIVGVLKIVQCEGECCKMLQALATKLAN
jgi:hypothetical protein